MIATSGEMAKDGISGTVHCQMQAFDSGDGRIRWAGWVTPTEGHPHWHPIVLCDGPYMLITNDGLELEITLCAEDGFFQGIQRAHRGAVMPSGWTYWLVVKKDNGAFDIFRNGELHHSDIPARWLERQLAPHGIFQDDFQDMTRQLAETDRASVSIPPLGKFSM